jgi:hypothetical protein
LRKATKSREHSREWRLANPERFKAALRAWQADPANKDRKKDLSHRSRLRLKDEMFVAYGGKCTCCGESTPEFLGIDHIDGRGYKPRDKHGLRIGGKDFYRWLRQQGFPQDEYRLHCHNCNQSRGYNGYCPHDLIREGVARPEAA